MGDLMQVEHSVQQPRQFNPHRAQAYLVALYRKADVKYAEVSGLLNVLDSRLMGTPEHLALFQSPLTDELKSALFHHETLKMGLADLDDVSNVTLALFKERALLYNQSFELLNQMSQKLSPVLVAMVQNAPPPEDSEPGDPSSKRARQ